MPGGVNRPQLSAAMWGCVDDRGSTVMVRLDSGVSVRLGAVVARAGEGTIYEVVGHGDWVAKIFHADLKDVAAKVAKVAAMIASPPEGVRQADGFVVLTWPLHVVSGDGGVVGYVMPRLDISNAVEIHTVSNPSNRANPLPSAPQWTPHVSWQHLVNIAANLCLAVETVHRVDAVIGDFQERNILVNDTTRVSLVDCDSMQFTDGVGHQFLCGVGRAEFTAPELAGVDLGSTAREKPSDLFALAVHVHVLLMAGNHPFLRGEWTGGGEQPDALTLARSGQWAGGVGSALRTHALAPGVDFLPVGIQRLFGRAFTDGARDPGVRPSAAEWREELLRIRFGACGRGHQVPEGTRRCPWCGIDDVRAVRRTRVVTPQRAMSVVAPPPSVSTAAGVSGGGRKLLMGVGAAGLVAVLALILTVAWSSSDSDTSTQATRSGATDSRAAQAQSQGQSCTDSPSFGSPSLSLISEGLAVDVPISVTCDSGVSITGANVEIAVSDGAKDVAAGVFNLNSQPVVVDGQARQRFVFPDGMYWRTPEMVSSSAEVTVAGIDNSAGSPSATPRAVVASQPLAPTYGTVDSVAGTALADLASADYDVVRNNLADRWVPQISSKRVGLVTDGITYANADILRNHLGLRQRYGAVRLVRSNNWTTFNGADWWVTVVGDPSGDSAVANRWCDSNGIDAWNCFAKYISATSGPEGTTVLRR